MNPDSAVEIEVERALEVLRRRGISADTALRLARYFQTTPQFWLNLQSHFELDTARLAEVVPTGPVLPSPAPVGTQQTEWLCPKSATSDVDSLRKFGTAQQLLD